MDAFGRSRLVVRAKESGLYVHSECSRDAELMAQIGETATGAFRSTADGELMSVNVAMAEMLRYDSPEELLSVSLTDLFSDERAFAEIFSSIDRSGHIKNVEWRMRRKDNTILWASASALGLCDSGGGLTGLAGILTDITENKEDEAKVRNLGQIIDMVNDAVILTDPDLRIVRWNKAAEHMYGWKESDAISRCFLELAETEFLHGDAGDVTTRVFESGRWMGESLQTAKNGLTFPVYCSVSRLTDCHGKVSGTAFVCQDVSRCQIGDDALKTALAELQSAKLALSRKAIALQEVIDQTHHERQKLGSEIVSNIEHILLPVLDRLEKRLDSEGQAEVERVRSSMSEITSPFAGSLHNEFARLTPLEIETCSMVRRGLSTKEIASVRCVSVETIRSQRKGIRKKLGISGGDANLASFLREFDFTANNDQHPERASRRATENRSQSDQG
jgi:PAS domain S-box-containing protein